MFFMFVRALCSPHVYVWLLENVKGILSLTYNPHNMPVCLLALKHSIFCVDGFFHLAVIGFGAMLFHIASGEIHSPLPHFGWAPSPSFLWCYGPRPSFSGWWLLPALGRYLRYLKGSFKW